MTVAPPASPATTSLTPEIEPNPKKRLERFVGRTLMNLVLPPIRLMPLAIAQRFGAGLGFLLYLSLGRYRRVCLKNLTLVYSDLSASQITKRAKAVFVHFGQVGVEFIKLPQMNRDTVDSLITVEGEENLKAALETGRGVLLITGHFGNWELMARWLTTHGYSLNVVARDARDPQTTKIMAETRIGSGANVLYRGNSARGILQALKRNEIAAILPDQNAADVFVPFFGFPTGTVDGPAVLHLKTQSPLLFSWCRREGNRFHLQFEPPVIMTPSEDKTQKSHDIERVMSLVNARLEAQIREEPTQWLWLHNRWKASPGVFPDGAENARIHTMKPREYRAYLEEKRRGNG